MSLTSPDWRFAYRDWRFASRRIDDKTEKTTQQKTKARSAALMGMGIDPSIPKIAAHRVVRGWISALVTGATVGVPACDVARDTKASLVDRKARGDPAALFARRRFVHRHQTW
ncbi:MAG: hypothetical protein ACFB00_07005 [Parvularculaceae bacterium]